MGAEVDTAFGHYNSFPMSVNQWEDRTFRYAIRTPGELLRMLRADPGEEIVQINHPRRWEPSARSGYFDERLNRETSEIEYPFFETGFDQVEIFNALTDAEDTGPKPAEGAEPDPDNKHYGRTDLVNQKLKDWYSLLNRGILMTGVGNTDAHAYPEHLPAYPRNYVLSDTDDPWKIDPLKVVNALKQRASTASCGPFIRFTANDGAQVGSIISDDDNSVTLRMNVQAAPWIPVDLVEVVSNGHVLAKFTVKPTAVEPVRFVRELVDRPTQDAWYLVIVTSNRRWPEPFPNYSSFAFTNPILVDEMLSCLESAKVHGYDEDMVQGAQIYLDRPDLNPDTISPLVSSLLATKYCLPDCSGVQFKPAAGGSINGISYHNDTQTQLQEVARDSFFIDALNKTILLSPKIVSLLLKLRRSLRSIISETSQIPDEFLSLTCAMANQSFQISGSNLW